MSISKLYAAWEATHSQQEIPSSQCSDSISQNKDAVEFENPNHSSHQAIPASIPVKSSIQPSTPRSVPKDTSRESSRNISHMYANRYESKLARQEKPSAIIPNSSSPSHAHPMTSKPYSQKSNNALVSVTHRYSLNLPPHPTKLEFEEEEEQGYSYYTTIRENDPHSNTSSQLGDLKEYQGHSYYTTVGEIPYSHDLFERGEDVGDVVIMDEEGWEDVERGVVGSGDGESGVFCEYGISVFEKEGRGQRFRAFEGVESEEERGLEREMAEMEEGSWVWL